MYVNQIYSSIGTINNYKLLYRLHNIIFFAHCSGCKFLINLDPFGDKGGNLSIVLSISRRLLESKMTFWVVLGTNRGNYPKTAQKKDNYYPKLSQKKDYYNVQGFRRFLRNPFFLPCNSKNVVNGAKTICNHSEKGRTNCMKDRTIYEDRSSRSREGLRGRM